MDQDIFIWETEPADLSSSPSVELRSTKVQPKKGDFLITTSNSDQLYLYLITEVIEKDEPTAAQEYGVKFTNLSEISQSEYSFDLQRILTEEIGTEELSSYGKNVKYVLFDGDKRKLLDYLSEIDLFQEDLESLSNDIKNNDLIKYIMEKLNEDDQSESSTQLSFVVDELESKMEDYDKEIENLNTKIENINATLHNNDIDRVKESYEQTIEELEEMTEQVNDLIENNEDLANRTANLAADTMGEKLGGEFRERKRNLMVVSIIWAILSAVSIGGLLLASYLIYLDLVNVSPDGNTITTISKVALLIPISVAVWFTTANYRRERKLMEIYSFKSMMSYSMDSYRDVLDNQLEKSDHDEVGVFMMQTMDRIYSNPYDELNQEEEDDTDGTGSVNSTIELMKKFRNK